MSNETKAPAVKTAVKEAPVMDPKILELAKKIQAKKEKQAEKRKGDLAAKYPHALLDTLEFDAAAGKYRCKIKCAKTGDTSQWVYTSDLWQVRFCESVSKEMKAAARKTKQAQIKEAMAFLKDNK